MDLVEVVNYSYVITHLQILVEQFIDRICTSTMEAKYRNFHIIRYYQPTINHRLSLWCPLSVISLLITPGRCTFEYEGVEVIDRGDQS